jgi:glycosyltransferase involved in cell wall biosynthesis
MKISLIVGTLGRDVELARFIDSVIAQHYDELELIVVDQNDDDRVERVLRDAPHLPARTVHLRAAPGLSRARNAGLLQATGEIVAFPDDDCWYPPGTLQAVVRRFAESPNVDVLTGRFVDEDGREEGLWPRHAKVVDRWNVWRCAISITIFARTNALGGMMFDPNLGAGSGTPFGSGEETDLLLRCLAAGKHIAYDPDLVLGHPVKTGRQGVDGIRRARSYSRGFGRVLRRHRYPIWYVVAAIAKPCLDAALAATRLEGDSARFFVEIARGRLAGWLARDAAGRGIALSDYRCG